MMRSKARHNQTLQATPVDASLETLSCGSGAPELHRSVTMKLSSMMAPKPF